MCACAPAALSVPHLSPEHDVPPAPLPSLQNNLIPVTLGNILAGSLCVATVYSLCYGSLGKKLAGTQ